MELSKQNRFAVQWHEGMLLSPQHFQQDQVYRENEKLHELSLTNPYFWGLVKFDYEPSGILSGKLKVRSVYGMMPDGLIVNYEDEVDMPLEIDLSDIPELEMSGDTTIVHLVVPIRTENAAHKHAPIQRFDSLPGSVVVDENTGENGVEVHRLSPRYGLYAGDNPPSRYVSIPLIQIKKENDGTFKSTSYVPPISYFRTRSVRSANAMFIDLERIVQAIRQKAIQLAGIAVSKSTGLSRSEREKKREISVLLGSVLPTLEVLLESNVHPFHAYSAFCDSVGRLAQLAETPVPPRLPAYQHNNLRNCFNTVIGFFASLLVSIKSQFSLLRFDYDRSEFSINLEKSEANDVLTIEVRGKKNASEESLVEFINTSRIVSESKFKAVKQGRLLGAKRQVSITPLFESSTEHARIVVQIQSSDPYIIFGERLIVSQASHARSHGVPESVWLYSSHEV